MAMIEMTIKQFTLKHRYSQKYIAECAGKHVDAVSKAVRSGDMIRWDNMTGEFETYQVRPMWTGKL